MSEHEHKYTVVVEKRQTRRFDSGSLEDLYLTKMIRLGDVDGWKVTKVMCEICSHIKDL